MTDKFALSVVVAAMLFAGACGDDSRPTRDGSTGTTDADVGDGNVGLDGEVGDTGIFPGGSVISGTAWAPGNAPGMVPAGHEIPVFGAIVRATPTRLDGIPQEAFCERCVDVSGNHVLTAHDGSFELGGLFPGEYWLSIQKGQFRIERQVIIGEGVFEAPVDYTTLPSVSDPENGDWVPRVAVAAGAHDDLQDVLGKMGMGEVDSSGQYMVGAGSDHVDFYDNGGTNYSTETGLTLAELVADLDRMLQYHVIFIPCAGSANTSALDEQQNLRNIRDYVAAGGRLYVTDWSGEWMDNVFPAHLTLGAGEDTPPEAYDRETDTWNTSLFGDSNGSLYDSNNAEAVDEDLNTWLSTQQGPLAEGGQGLFDPNYMDVVDNWNTIEDVNPVEIGVDSEGLPIGDTPHVYVIGGEGTSTPKTPLTVTFQPAGCGRVLYSTYHTTPDSHQGLVPQERILLYLIMEIGVCVDDPILI